MSIWWADLALWEQQGANALWACRLLRQVSGSAAVFPGGWWEGYLCVPAPGIYMAENLRMKHFRHFALRPSPRIVLTHLEVLLKNKDLLILDKGKAVSGIIRPGLLLIHLEKCFSFYCGFKQIPQWATTSIVYVGKWRFHQRHLLWSRKDKKLKASVNFWIIATANGASIGTSVAGAQWPFI